MNTGVAPAGHFVEEFERVAATLPGRGSVSDRRKGAIDRFRAAGLPGPRNEAWKYTNVTPLARGAFRAATRADAAAPAAAVVALMPEQDDAIRLVFVNGYLREDLCGGDTPPAGVSIRSVAQALRETPEQLSPLGKFEDEAFVALNEAFYADGAIISLAAGVAVERPIELLFIATGEAELAVYPRVVVRAGAGAKARILERYRGDAQGSRFTNSVTRIEAAEGSRVEHTLVQEEASRTIHIGHLGVEQAKGSAVVSHSIALGGLLARRDIDVRLEAEDAAVVLNGIYMAGGRQHIDHHTRIDHLAPHTRSEEFYRGILQGYGRAVFNGKVVVHPGAIKTDARQANHNLLLSADAEIDTKPELQIYADDVKCAHGATVGQLDADALFYLRARGLDEASARGLLMYAFAADLIGRVSIASLRRELTRSVAGQLPGTDLEMELP